MATPACTCHCRDRDRDEIVSFLWVADIWDPAYAKTPGSRMSGSFFLPQTRIGDEWYHLLEECIRLRYHKFTGISLEHIEQYLVVVESLQRL